MLPISQDHGFFRSSKNALIQERPVLIETGSVSMSTLYSLILLKHRIPHNLLNATTAAKRILDHLRSREKRGRNSSHFNGWTRYRH